MLFNHVTFVLENKAKIQLNFCIMQFSNRAPFLWWLEFCWTTKPSRIRATDSPI